MSSRKAGRKRGPINGGYVRKTVSLPSSLNDRIDAYLDDHEGITISGLATVALTYHLSQTEPRKKAR